MYRRRFVAGGPVPRELSLQLPQFLRHRGRQFFCPGFFPGGFGLLPKHVLAGERGHAGGQVQFLLQNQSARPGGFCLSDELLLPADRGECDADVFGGNAREMFQPVAAEQLALFRRRRGDDGAKRRFIERGVLEFAVDLAQGEGRFRQALAGVLK